MFEKFQGHWLTSFTSTTLNFVGIENFKILCTRPVTKKSQYSESDSICTWLIFINIYFINLIFNLNIKDS